MKKFIDEFKYRPQTPEIVATSDYNAFPNKRTTR